MNTVKREPLKHPISLALEPIILGLCRYPDDCQINEHGTDGTLAVTIVPHRADFRIVCGRAGRQIKALKYLAARAGELRGCSVELNLEEGLVGAPEPKRDFQQDPEFDVPALIQRIQDAAGAVLGRFVAVEHERSCDRIDVYLEVSPDEAEDIPTVVALADVFYPACVKDGITCKIKPKKKFAPVPAR